MSTSTAVAMPLLTFVPGAMGGSERFALRLIEALGARDDVVLRTVVSGVGSGTTPAGTETIAARVPGGASTLARVATLGRSLLPDRRVAAVLEWADVVHYPFSVPVPGPGDRPFVQTLHDVQHHDFPGFFGLMERTYRRFAYDRTSRRADAVVTISSFSRERIVDVLGVDPAKVFVIAPGVDLPTTRWTGGGGFVLYPSRMWPHKNHARLIEAMEAVRKTHDLRLVLTGGDAAGFELPSWVDNRGLVSDPELHELYRSAECVAFPSLYEGFGMPVIEAMGFGCPVASSTAGALSEVCADAAVMFDPTDVESMAAAICLAVDSGQRLGPAGLARAEQFSWHAVASKHAELYRSLTR